MNPSYEMRAYIESDEPTALTEMEASLAGVGVQGVRLETLRLLAEFFEIARDVIPRQLGGDAPDEMFPGEGPQTGDVWFRKHMYRWFRKVVALDDAASGFDDVLFWLDCDCYSKRPLPLDIIERAFAGAGVVHMKGRKREHSETGLVGYDLAVPGTRELLEAMKRHYLTRSFIDLPRWDDCITLDLLLAREDAPPSRDIAGKIGPGADVLGNSIFGAFFEHEKGLHSRKLGLVT